MRYAAAAMASGRPIRSTGLEMLPAPRDEPGSTAYWSSSPNSSVLPAWKYSRNTAICIVWGKVGFTQRRVCMADSLAGVVLAAGAGERLRPLTRIRPKVLCPIGDRPLLDHALARFEGVTTAVAVNVHHGRELIENHLAGRVHLSFEDEQALGTAGALGRLRPWIDGRPVLVANGDTWCPTSMSVLLDGWDGTTIRVLSRSDFGPRMVVAGALMPWDDVAEIDDEPAGLYEASWRAVHADEGRVEIVLLADDAPCFDCGTPRDYLEANLAWSGGESVVGAGAVVRGTIEQSVLWPGVEVAPSEHLVRAIRARDNVTVVVR